MTATTHSAAEYTITFDANGGQFTTSDRSLTATLGCKLPDCIPAPTRSQHVFRGWKTADGVEYYGASGSKSLSSYPVAGDVTLYAEWAFKNQTIVFPGIGVQVITNTLVLGATASSGLAVSYAVDGPAVLDGAVLSFTDAGMVTVTASQAGDEEWGAAEDVVRSFEVVKMAADVTLGGLSWTYDGEAKEVTVETVPEGLAVVVTYDGSEALPVHGGSYAVVATVEDRVWAGRAEGTMNIARAGQEIAFSAFPAVEAVAWTNVVELESVAGSGLPVEYAVVSGPGRVSGNELTFTGPGTVVVEARQNGDRDWEAAEPVAQEIEVGIATALVSFADLAQIYDGEAKQVSVVTTPSGLGVDVTYDGEAALPVGAGRYAVAATVVDEKWEGSGEAVLVVSKGSQSIEFGEIGAQAATNVVELSAVASTGMEVKFAVLSGPGTVEGNTLSFTGAGTVTVMALQEGDANWAQATVLRSVSVSAVPVEVVLSGLERVYDGEGKAVGVATVPEGVAVRVTYDGSEGAPVGAGEYAVVAESADGRYAGRAEGVLVIAKGAQSIEFAEIGEQVATNVVELGAVASSGLAVSYSVEGAAVLEGSTLSFTGAGTVTVTASQAGDGNWEAAEDVVRSFEVVKASATVTLGRLAQRYDGTTKAVTVNTVPDGLNVTVTYDGSGDAPQEIGHYTVVATVEDTMWAGSAEGTLVITMPPEVLNVTAVQRWPWNGLVDLEFAVDNPEGATLSSFTATDGETGTSVAMATLTKEDGTAVAEGEELAAGTHRWVWDAGADMEDGFESDSMMAECKIRGRQSIYFSAIGNRHSEERVTLSATASSGGAVAFSVQSGPGTISGNVLSFTGTGTVVVAASQAGDEDWWPASATQSVNVEWPLYMVVNLSGGTNASSYPVTYMNAAPSGGFNTDTYKTTQLVLRRINAGTFKMNGSYQVTLTKPFYTGLFEVTQKQWKLVMGSNPSGYTASDMCPVEHVSYDNIRGRSSGAKWPASNAVDAGSFLGKLRAKTGLEFDLPTEAQWEYACRAGTTSSYNNGGSNESDLKQLGRYIDNVYDAHGGLNTCHTKVGSYKANAWGLYDMHGNVPEWCLDWYGSLSAGTDPKGASSGSSRVERGGGHHDYASGCTSSIRDYCDPSWAGAYIGFRIVRSQSK